MALNDDTRVKPNFKVVLIDETEYWNLESVPEIDKVWGTYLVDFNCHTFCCELTPSYWCEWLFSQYEAKKFYESADWYDEEWERRREEIASYIDEGDYQANSSGSYFHTSFFSESNPRVRVISNFEISSELEEEYLSGEIDYNKMLDEAREELNWSGEAYI